jgi:ribosomal protein S18 acetylase RimI-like enzyme
MPTTSPPRRAAGSTVAKRAAAQAADGQTVAIRPVRRGDLDRIVAIDARATGIEKRAYWQSVYRRYGVPSATGRQFLVADAGARVVGFVIGEVRDWEFGSPPCGWVFGINVEADARLAGIGTRLLAAIYAGFRRAGVRTVRTMLGRDNNLVLSFFRSQGMMTGPFIPLEMDLAEAD